MTEKEKRRVFLFSQIALALHELIQYERKTYADGCHEHEALVAAEWNAMHCHDGLEEFLEWIAKREKQ